MVLLSEYKQGFWEISCLGDIIIPLNLLYSIIRLLSHTLACEATFFILINNSHDRSSTL